MGPKPALPIAYMATPNQKSGVTSAGGETEGQQRNCAQGCNIESARDSQHDSTAVSQRAY